MKYFNSIRMKVWLCANVAFIGLLVALASSFYSNAQLASFLTGLRDHDFPVTIKSQEILILFKKQKQLYEEGFLIGEPELVAEGDYLQEKILTLFDEIMRSETVRDRIDTKTVEIFYHTRKKILDYFSQASPLFVKLAQGEPPDQLSNDIRRVGQLQDEIIEGLEEGGRHIHLTLQQEMTASRDLTRDTTFFLILLFFLVSILSYLSINVLAKRLLIDPLGAIKRMVRNFGDGILEDETISVSSSDEIGDLAVSFQKMAEDLRQKTVSKDYVDQILTNMKDALVVVSPELTIKTVNPALLHLLGYLEAELIDQPIDRIMLANPRGAGLCTAAGEGIREQIPLRHNVEEIFVAKGGRHIPVLFSESVLTGKDGEVEGVVCVAIDISDLKNAQNQIKEQAQFLESVFESIQHPLYVVDVNDYQIVLCNSALEVFGYRPGMKCYELVNKLDSPCHLLGKECPLNEIFKTGRPAVVEQVHSGRIFEIHGYPIFDQDGQVSQMIEYALDITERKEAERKMIQLAQYDFLTGLPNRFLFHDRLLNALQKAQREREMVAVLFLDLDRFKVINDSLGHSSGDALLKAVAKKLSESLRGSDSIARFGGDEFAIILPGFRAATDIIPMVSRIIESFALPLGFEGHEIFSSASIGIAVFPRDGDNPEVLLKNADIAMYQAKECGGNNYRFFSRDMNVRSLERLTLESDIRQALKRDELTIFYQVQIDLQTGLPIGTEALLRWHSPSRGTVLPGKFIPLLEETGLIIPVGEWVLRTVCLQARRWQEQGEPPIKVAVNISGRQLRQENFLGMIESVLAESGLDPILLELELTESVILQNAQENIKILNSLKKLGITLAIDDFGTGYSSLSYLKYFPIDKLKIDRSFIRHIGQETGDEGIALAIIAMAKSLKIRVNAEGVETEQQVDFLRRHECDEVQGYYFGTPVNAADFQASAFRHGKRTPLLPVTGSLSPAP